jgi:hypothetical protein
MRLPAKFARQAFVPRSFRLPGSTPGPGSIALTLALIEAQSLRSHALYLLIKCVSFLIEPFVLRFRRLAAAQLFECFLNGEFGGFGHGRQVAFFTISKPLSSNSRIIALAKCAHSSGMIQLGLLQSGSLSFG